MTGNSITEFSAEGYTSGGKNGVQNAGLDNLGSRALWSKREWKKRTHLSTHFNAVFSWGAWVFFPITYRIFFLLYSLQVTLSITPLNICYIVSMECSDYRFFFFCISNKKDVRNLSLEDIFHFLLCTFACYEIFGRKSECYHIRGCLCIWCCLEYRIHLLPELKISWHI